MEQFLVTLPKIHVFFPPGVPVFQQIAFHLTIPTPKSSVLQPLSKVFSQSATCHPFRCARMDVSHLASKMCTHYFVYLNTKYSSSASPCILRFWRYSCYWLWLPCTSGPYVDCRVESHFTGFEEGHRDSHVWISDSTSSWRIFGYLSRQSESRNVWQE